MVLGGAVVTLKLFKAAEGKWGRLLVELPRKERLKRREASRAMAAEEAEAAVERKKRAQWDDSRFSLGHQMDKDRERRLRIDEYKTQEAAAEAAAMEAWQAQAEEKARAAGLSTLNAPIESRAGRVIAGKDPNRSLQTRRAEQAAAKAGAPPPQTASEEITDPCGIVDITDGARSQPPPTAPLAVAGANAPAPLPASLLMPVPATAVAMCDRAPSLLRSGPDSLLPPRLSLRTRGRLRRGAAACLLGGSQRAHL